MASPIPDAPPVTMAVLPARKRSATSPTSLSDSSLVRRLDVAHLHVHALYLGVVVDGDQAVLPADPGLLVAAEGHLDRGDVVVVDPGGARLEPRHHPMGALDVRVKTPAARP